jgi:hypothetical protein
VEDVHLVDRGQPPATLPGDREGAPGDALDLRSRVLAGVEPRAVVARALLAEIEAADQLADDHEVDPLRTGGPKVRVDAELPAQAQQALLRPHRPPFELWEADRAEEHGVGPPARRERLVGKRRALLEDRVAAERVLAVRDPERVEDPRRLGRHLGPDPVAGEDGDAGHATSWAVSYAAIASSCCSVRAISSRP